VLPELMQTGPKKKKKKKKKKKVVKIYGRVLLILHVPYHIY
jgi:hypothetical protein